ncbi:MAG: lipopolysaccharide assembly LapA domain-containing protein [Candidatus Methylomirabilia bacterium]
MLIAYLLVAVVAIVATTFAFQNAHPVAIRLLVWELEGVPLVVVILISGGLGVLVMSLRSLAQRLKLRSQIRQLESRLRHPESSKPVD